MQVNRQDLNANVMTASNRMIDHTTFSEMHWKRDLFSPHFFVLPVGFQTPAHLFSEEFIEVIKDIHALQCIRESASFACEDTVSILHVDNHQAWIQSRLMNLPDSSAFQECCHLAAYLSACMLCCKVWRSSVIPVSNLPIEDLPLYPYHTHIDYVLLSSFAVGSTKDHCSRVII